MDHVQAALERLLPDPARGSPEEPGHHHAGDLRLQFPQRALASVYAASNRDFRIVLATDALSCGNDVTQAELARMGVYLMTSDQCLAWLSREAQVAAA